ncbi:lipoprotein [Streptococcus suis]|uniref:LptM family lipoprotein n=1 Tax=Streptococcus suis TaxID=1307 RepID=UPI000CF6AA76|nr:hypothetical protein [Streptococcus suis]
MKKILGLIAVVFSLILLAACGVSNTDSLDGEYAELWTASNTGEIHLETSDPMVIKDTTVENMSGFTNNLAIDTEKKIFISSNNETFSYVYKDGILQVNGDTYYKIGSKAYEEKAKELGQE